SLLEELNETITILPPAQQIELLRFARFLVYESGHRPTIQPKVNSMFGVLEGSGTDLTAEEFKSYAAKCGRTFRASFRNEYNALSICLCSRHSDRVVDAAQFSAPFAGSESNFAASRNRRRADLYLSRIAGRNPLLDRKGEIYRERLSDLCSNAQ